MIKCILYFIYIAAEKKQNVSNDNDANDEEELILHTVPVAQRTVTTSIWHGNVACRHKWFHYQCVGLTSRAIPPGKWFCPLLYVNCSWRCCCLLRNGWKTFDLVCSFQSTLFLLLFCRLPEDEDRQVTKCCTWRGKMGICKRTLFVLKRFNCSHFAKRINHYYK